MADLLPWLKLIFSERRRLLIGALLILLTLLSGLGLLALSGWFITATAVAGLLLAAGLPATLNIYVPGGGIRLFAVTRTVGRYLERVYNHDTVLRLLALLRVRLFRNLASQPGSQRQRIKSADWLNRLTSDLDAMDTLYLRLIAPTALGLGLTAALVLVAWLGYSAQLALATGGLLGAALLISTVLLHWRNRATAHRRIAAQNELRERVIDQLLGQAELTAAGVLLQSHNDLARRSAQSASEQSRMERNTVWHRALAGVCINLAVVTALWLGLGLYESAQLSGPVVVLYPLMLLAMVEVYTVLPDAFGVLGGTQAAARRLSLLAHGPGANPPMDPPGAQQEPLSHDALMCFSNVTVRSSEHVVILEVPRLEVRSGEWLGITGVSGCGKSTLADLAAGLITPDQGSVERSASLSRMAYLQQRTVLFNNTVRNNLIPDGRMIDDHLLWQMLEVVQLTERIMQMPGQLDGWLGGIGSQLSGGEARRMVLARTLLREAPLTILDEPFTGVDAPTARVISGKMRDLLADKAVLVLAHDASALPGTDRLVELSPPQGI
ncbi:amino acid ABC transporter ATP-binding/permease protein [Marinobacter mobilis]|uniref:amino acid ABC transporter ATP-binding/permease protein n=1 Tax=Marinobacter mobilis TaxID=488533 RepID=UPI0035C75E76